MFVSDVFRDNASVRRVEISLPCICSNVNVEKRKVGYANKMLYDVLPERNGAKMECF